MRRIMPFIIAAGIALVMLLAFLFTDLGFNTAPDSPSQMHPSPEVEAPSEMDRTPPSAVGDVTDP